MIRRHIYMSAIAATAVLTGCSGSKDNPSPTPTPTSSVTPTPTPTATYTGFPLAAQTEFNTFDAAISYTGDPATGAVTLGTPITETLTNRVRLATGPSPTVNTYVMHENVEETRFATATPTVPSAPANPEFIFRSDDTTTAGKFAQIEFLNNVVPNTITSDTALALSRVSYANWWRGDSTSGQKRLTYTTWGYGTLGYDMPTTGTVTYSVRVVGRLVSVAGNATAINRVTGTATMSTNFATGVVNVSMTLSTLPAGGGAAVPYGTFTAQGGIPSGQNQWTGSFTTGSPLSGTLAGGFFGYQAEQVGVVFSAAGTFNGADQRLIGVVVGKK